MEGPLNVSGTAEVHWLTNPADEETVFLLQLCSGPNGLLVFDDSRPLPELLVSTKLCLGFLLFPRIIVVNTILLF